VLKTFISYFNKPTAQTVAKEKVLEFEREYLMHVTSAEYHFKLAEYYKESAVRMNSFKSVSKV